MSVTIAFPLTDAQATAIVIAAERFGVEAWEMAAHVLKIRTLRELLQSDVEALREDVEAGR